VAAIPAGILAALLVLVFLNYSEGLSAKPAAMGMVGGTLIACLVLVATPPVLLIPRRQKAAAAKKSEESSATAAVDDDGEIAIEDGEVAVMDEDDTEVAETVDFDSGALETDTDDLAEVSDSDMFLDDEEEAPKPKKKKK
jgi:hypothetical protein